MYLRAPGSAAGRRPVVVTTEHSIGETHPERRKITAGVRALYLATDLCSNGTIAVSQTVLQGLIAWGVPGRKISVIPNGLNVDHISFDPAARERVRAELGIPGEARVVGVLGRLESNTQFDTVITAAAPLLGEDTWLMVAGEGTQREHLRHTAAAAGVTGQVVSTGERHDVAAVLSALDVFVASSRQETFGLSVLEALAGGLPALIRLADCESAYGRVVNLGRSEQIRIAGLARLVIAVTGSASRGTSTPYGEAYGSGYEDIPRRVPGCSLAGRLAGFRPTKSLDDIIRGVAEQQHAPTPAVAEAR